MFCDGRRGVSLLDGRREASLLDGRREASPVRDSFVYILVCCGAGFHSE